MFPCQFVSYWGLNRHELFVVTWPLHPSLSAASCQNSVPPWPTTSLPPWAPSVSQSAPLKCRVTPPSPIPSFYPLVCVTPAFRAHHRPATANGTAHCGTPGAPSRTATWTVPAAVSSALWTAATLLTAPPSPVCWLRQQRPWVELLCQVRRDQTRF